VYTHKTSLRGKGMRGARGQIEGQKVMVVAVRVSGLGCLRVKK